MRQSLIQVVPLSLMRYRTLGDYYDSDAGRIFKVADLGNEDYEFLIAIHEQIEEYLTRKAGIRETDIADFDKHFEAERDIGLHKPEDEPGNDPRAPYRPQHRFAENIERLIAAELGVDWFAYERTCVEAL